uniref:F-box domain-containing protein n=1 Tax=Chrysotila carterae TaxID=13221 RepID=A0A7S4C6V7_CHRCT
MSTVEEVQVVVGQVSRSELLAVLGAELASQQPHWAANTFFRRHFEKSESVVGSAAALVRRSMPCREKTSTASHAPRTVCAADCSAHSSGGTNTADERSGEVAAIMSSPATSPDFSLWLCLTEELQRQVMTWLSLPSLGALSCCSRDLRALCQESSLWFEAYRRQWPWAIEVADWRTTPHNACWRQWLRQELERQASLQCVRCDAHGRTVPRVYGFPSRPLMAAAAAQCLVMGWDYKTPRDASWQCLECGVASRHFPWPRRRVNRDGAVFELGADAD